MAKISLGALILLLVGVGLWLAIGPKSNPTDSQTQYQVSDEIIDPYELVNNPYRLKGHSGILDTVDMAVFMWDGTRTKGPSHYPGGNLRFEKMIDEYTATYQVVAVGGAPQGEIAVILPDSNPPDPQRPWRVFVDGPKEFVNGYGATITGTTLSFEGYYSPEPSHSNSSPAPQPGSGPQATVIQQTVTASDEGDPAAAMAPASGSAAPATPVSTPPIARQLKWNTEPNGDEALTGASGHCATMHLFLDGTNKVRVTFSDGSSKDFSVDQTADAMQSATDFCNAMAEQKVAAPN